jgi:hypothetical protein
MVYVDQLKKQRSRCTDQVRENTQKKISKCGYRYDSMFMEAERMGENLLQDDPPWWKSQLIMVKDFIEPQYWTRH